MAGICGERRYDNWEADVEYLKYFYGTDQRW